VPADKFKEKFGKEVRGDARGSSRSTHARARTGPATPHGRRVRRHRPRDMRRLSQSHTAHTLRTTDPRTLAPHIIASWRA
jgi:hypothetical protein